MKKVVYFLTLCMVMLLASFTMACSGDSIDKVIDGKIDEGNFVGTTIKEVIPLETDSFIDVDGELQEECWQDRKWFEFNYNGVEVRTTTVFSDLGFYVGFDIGDKHVYGNPNRMVWMGASIEMYVDRGDSTQRTGQTFQYRLSALNVVELLHGRQNPEDYWTFKYLPIYGLAKVDGVINSGETKGLFAEVFVRWDALGYDMDAEDFTRPQSVKIMPAYNQSTGSEMTSPRAYWCNNGGDINSPMQYWLFDDTGFADGDADNAVIGDNKQIGRAKSFGWDVTKESEGIVSSKTASDQTIYFKDIYSEQYIATTLVDYNEALPFWNGNNYTPDPYPKAGIIMAANETVHAFVMDYNAASTASADTFQGMFFKKGNPDPRDSYWQLFDPMLLNLDPTQPVRLTTVKVGKYLLAFVGDKDTARYGGILVGMQEVPTISGAATPGFYTLGCKATFTDYAATSDVDTVKSKIQGVLSLLEINNKVGGQITSDSTGYRTGETATLTIRTTNNYKLTSLKVNGTEKITDIVDGMLSLTMTDDTVLVEPTYSYMTEDRYTVSGNIVFTSGTNAYNGTEVIILSSTNSISAYYTPDTTGAYEAYLPSGNYKAIVRLFGIYKTSVDFTINNEDLTIPEIAIKGNLEFENTDGLTYNSDGSIVISNGNNVNKVFKNSTLTNKDFFIKTSLQRVDGIFVENGTWSTGGILINVDGKNYRFFVMKEDNNRIVVYANILENHSATVELRNDYAYDGTGAPIDIMFIYRNNQIELVLNNEKHITITSQQLGDNFKDLFSTTKAKKIGLCVIDSPSNKGIRFNDFDFGIDTDKTLEAIATVAYPVTINAGEGGSVSGADYIFAGDTEQYTIVVEGDNNLATLTVNGEDKLNDVVGGKLSVQYTGAAVTIEATFNLVTKYDVTGSYSYASGLYLDDDTVTVTCGSTVGVVDSFNKTFSIRLQDGSRDIVVSSTRYKSVTITKTISQAADIGNFEFTSVKLADDSNVTYNNDGSFSIDAMTKKELAAATITGGFEINYSLERKDGDFFGSGWNTGGLGIKVGSEWFRIFIQNEGSQIIVVLNNDTNWAVNEHRFNYTAFSGAPMTMSVAIVNDTMYLYLDGYMKYSIAKADCHANVQAIFSAGAKTLGLVSVDQAMKFSNVSYSPITQVPAKYTTNTNNSGLNFDNTDGIGFGEDGNFVLESNNYKGLTDGTNAIKYNGNFEMTVKFQRSDKDFAAWGSWDTGGIGLKVGGDVFYIYVMKENATDDVVYVRNVTKDKTAEYRQGGVVAGTGAPVSLKLTFTDGVFSLLINDTLTYTLNKDNAKNAEGATYTVDADIQKLFDVGTDKEIGIAALHKSILFESNSITHKAIN